MPRSRSSGALSIWSYAMNCALPEAACVLVIAAVRVVLPWSTWPIVPMLTCGLLRMNFSLDILRPHPVYDSLGERRGTRCVGAKLHRVRSAPLRGRTNLRQITEHRRERAFRG